MDAASSVSSLKSRDYAESLPVEHCTTSLTNQMDTFLKESRAFIGLHNMGSPVKEKMERKKFMKHVLKKHTASMPNLLQDGDSDLNASAASLKNRLAGIDKSLAKSLMSKSSSGSKDGWRATGSFTEMYSPVSGLRRKLPARPLGGTVYLTEGPEADPAHKKYMVYAGRPQGHFPHPTIAGKPGLPFMRESDLELSGEGLPSMFVKPLANTSSMHYNDFRQAHDRYEQKQREMNYYLVEQHRSNREMAKLITPCSKMPGDLTYIHGTTKPLGRLHFDNGVDLASLSEKQAGKILKGGPERGKYTFWS